MKEILFFTPFISPPVAEKLAGVYDAARTLDWRIRPVELGRSGRRAADFVRLWRPAGAIVECADYLPLSPADLKGAPVVWLDRDPDVKGGLSVNLDAALSADLAVAELVTTSPSAIAFVGWHEDVWWSRIRRDRTLQCAKSHSLPFHAAPAGCWSPDAFAGEDEPLKAFLKSLPRGCGIFAANDRTAERVIAAAEQCRLSVPADLTVVGADNDLFLCENSRPTISSVVSDFRKIGEMSVRMLERRLADPSFNRSRDSAPPKRVVRRESSRPFRAMDASIVKALELIRRESVNGLDVSAVVDAMGCSRRTAEMRFKSALGHTILDEIREERLNAAMDLLSRPGQAIEPIANLCGWDSPVTLKRLFKARTGQTMREWRNSRRA